MKYYKWFLMRDNSLFGPTTNVIYGRTKDLVGGDWIHMSDLYSAFDNTGFRACFSHNATPKASRFFDAIGKGSLGVTEQRECTYPEPCSYGLNCAKTTSDQCILGRKGLHVFRAHQGIWWTQHMIWNKNNGIPVLAEVQIGCAEGMSTQTTPNSGIAVSELRIVRLIDVQPIDYFVQMNHILNTSLPEIERAISSQVKTAISEIKGNPVVTAYLKELGFRHIFNASMRDVEDKLKDGRGTRWIPYNDLSGKHDLTSYSPSYAMDTKRNKVQIHIKYASVFILIAAHIWKEATGDYPWWSDSDEHGAYEHYTLRALWADYSQSHIWHISAINWFSHAIHHKYRIPTGLLYTFNTSFRNSMEQWFDSLPTLI